MLLEVPAQGGGGGGAAPQPCARACCKGWCKASAPWGAVPARGERLPEAGGQRTGCVCPREYAQSRLRALARNVMCPVTAPALLMWGGVPRAAPAPPLQRARCPSRTPLARDRCVVPVNRSASLYS